MATMKLTDLHLRNLKSNPEKQIEIFDSQIPGFSVRRSPSGTLAFSLHYRMDGRLNRRFTLGRYPDLSLSDARKLAAQARQQIAQGIDPASKKQSTRANYQSKLFPTVAEEFIENHAKRHTKKWKETQSILLRDFKCWRHEQIQNIKRQDVVAALDAIVKSGRPSAANHARATIVRCFNWAVERGIIEHSPCVGIKAPSPNTRRERVLSEAELQRIYIAAQSIGYPFGVLIQLLLHTSQRRSEVGGMRWAELDFEKAEWTLAADRNKSHRSHVVPLSTTALELLLSLPRLHGQLVFPARGRDRPISGWSKWKHQLDHLAGVSDWTLHDLRRTAATGMARLKVRMEVVERILNHKSGSFGGVAGIYNRHAYLAEMRDALELWDKHIMTLVQEAKAKL